MHARIGAMPQQITDVSVGASRANDVQNFEGMSSSGVRLCVLLHTPTLYVYVINCTCELQ